MEICLNSEDLSVALYASQAEAALLMGYHPQRQGGKVQAAEIKAVTSDQRQYTLDQTRLHHSERCSSCIQYTEESGPHNRGRMRPCENSKEFSQQRRGQLVDQSVRCCYHRQLVPEILLQLVKPFIISLCPFHMEIHCYCFANAPI